MSTLGTLTYGYDANGQRTSVGGSYARTGLPAALASASYDDANQIATFGGTSFSYDDNGNLTSDGVRSYTWNARKELASLTGPVNGTFAYDAFGRRRSKTVGGTTTQFLYDGLNPVQELQSGTPTANLLTGLGIDEYFTRTDAAGVRNLLTDALGSTVALADGSGTLQTEYSYEPFGGTTASGGGTSNSFAFTGREADGTGLYFYRARYYDGRLQRFLTQDPIGILGGTNLYAYVRNGPSSFVDPLGLQAVNRSPNPWWIKPENESEPVCVPPGGSYGSPIDGAASPHGPRPPDVLKIPDYTWLIVLPDGTPAVYAPVPVYVPPIGMVSPVVRVPVDSIPNVHDRVPGWKDPSFAERHPDWKPLFNAGTPPTDGRKPEPCPAK
jgi:RHS repeat-associated protein